MLQQCCLDLALQSNTAIWIWPSCQYFGALDSALQLRPFQSYQSLNRPLHILNFVVLISWIFFQNSTNTRVEHDIIDWVNSKLETSGKESRIATFQVLNFFQNRQSWFSRLCAARGYGMQFSGQDPLMSHPCHFLL